MIEKLKRAEPYELQIWMWSAFIFGIGLGAFFYSYMQKFALWIILVSLIVHLWAMYKIYLSEDYSNKKRKGGEK